VDDGTSEFSMDLKYQAKNGIEQIPSILHIVFPFSTLERSAYFFLDKAIKNEIESGFRKLPFWLSPIQARIIAYDINCLEDSKKLATELKSLNFRVDLDDREMKYEAKKMKKDLKWIPYIITVDKNNKDLKNLIVEKKNVDIDRKTISLNELIGYMKSEEGSTIVIPQYFPVLLSKREIFNQKRRTEIEQLDE
jgi:threonyl-tRNA synthetase